MDFRDGHKTAHNNPAFFWTFTNKVSLQVPCIADIAVPRARVSRAREWRRVWHDVRDSRPDARKVLPMAPGQM